MANDFSGDANCVALYNFESGALTTDSKGGNTLTDNNTVGTSATAKQGSQSADFDDDAGEYFSVTDANLDAGFPMKNGDSTKIISVCFWVYLNSTDTWQGFLGKSNGTGDKRSFVIYSDSGGNNIRAGNGYNTGASIETVNHASNMSTGQWYHVGVVHDGVGKTILIRIWDDVTNGGEQFGTDIDTTWANETNVEDANFNIGTINNSTTTFAIDALMDEVVIFKDKLTAAEIDEIRAGTYGAAAGGISIPVAWHHIHRHRKPLESLESLEIAT